MYWRKLFLILGIFFVLAGVFMPRQWYDAVPKSEADLTWIRQDNPQPIPNAPPIQGVTLLQISFVIEGLAFLLLSLKRRTYQQISSDLLLSDSKLKNENAPERFWLLTITAITILAFFLRFFRIDSELWIDEIVTIMIYSPMSSLHILTGFVSANNHLLNTLLMKFSITIFGEHEWAVRLPSAIFGALTIPLFYKVSRLIFSPIYSLSAALLLTVSYHHIFYSQNVRGYSMQLFFTILAGGLLVKGLQNDELKIWILYCVAMFLNMASLLNSGFVFAAHILIAFAALVIIKLRGDSPFPLMRRLIGVFAVTTFFVVQLYGAFIPQAFVYIQTTWGSKTTQGFLIFSSDFLAELIRGISAGLGSTLILIAFPFAAIFGGIGFFILFRRQWTLMSAFILPIILTLSYVILQNLAIYPRFFLLALPLAILVTIQGIDTISRFILDKINPRFRTLTPKVVIVFVLLGCVVSLISLNRYYTVPKQPYRTSLEYIKANRQPGEIIIAVNLMEAGYRYYGKEFGLQEDIDFFIIHSEKMLDDVLSKSDQNNQYLVTTFFRGQSATHPELMARIQQDWMVVKTFPATLGDGEVTVWRQKNLKMQ